MWRNSVSGGCLRVSAIILLAANVTRLHAQDDGKFIVFRQNKVELGQPTLRDTVEVEDPETGDRVMKTYGGVRKPSLLNGEVIYNTDIDSDEVIVQPKYKGWERSIRDRLLRPIKRQLRKLPDDTYYLGISNIVTDENGRVVCFEYGGVYSIHETRRDTLTTTYKTKRKAVVVDSGKGRETRYFMCMRIYNENRSIPPVVDSFIFRRIKRILKHTRMTPAIYDGKRVPYLLNEVQYDLAFPVYVKGGRVFVTDEK